MSVCDWCLSAAYLRSEVRGGALYTHYQDILKEQSMLGKQAACPGVRAQHAHFAAEPQS